MKNFGQMMQQAKRMQEQMQKMQDDLAGIEVTGEAGGGMVHVLMSGARLVRRIEIDPSLWAEQDKALTEDLVAAACNAALKAVDDKAQEMQKKLLGGLPLPPGFSL